MSYSDQLFKALGIEKGKGGNINSVAKEIGVLPERLDYYNKNNIVPTGNDLDSILAKTALTDSLIKLKMGRVDEALLAKLQKHADEIYNIIGEDRLCDEASLLEPKFRTSLGELYQADCLDLLRTMKSDSVDLVFADPPFNLSKLYPSEIDDNLKKESYIKWSQEWIYECVRVLKHGGALFMWNIPKWNLQLGSYFDGLLTFRNWIGVDIKYSLPIRNRLYPSHYSLTYYVKGERPKTFNPDRLPMQTCPKCFSDLKDYGGYKDKMNPAGINLTDIWNDIPPVRHAKYKRRNGANELSLKLLDRIIEMASVEGDLIFDPFGGSGTTYMAAELKGRKWIGCEVGPVDEIINRFDLIEEERAILASYRSSLNKLFPSDVERNREKRGLWTCESVRNRNR